MLSPVNALKLEYTQSREHACLSFVLHSKINSGCGAVNSLPVKSS